VSIQAQRYAANGTPLGGEFQVNTYTTSFQAVPAVGVDGQGNFVVAWTSNGGSGTDTNTASIQARRYDGAGTALGGQFQVNSLTTNTQAEPSVAVAPQGVFVVSFRSAVSSGSDTAFASVQARRYAPNGVALTQDFQINSYTSGNQLGPVIAADGQGNFVVAWMSEGSSGTDTSDWSVQAQRYSVFVFNDGFETRNTLAWTSETPALPTPDAYRWSDIDLRDPHVFANLPIFGCSDVTDNTPLGPEQSVNGQIQQSISTDGDAEGGLDLSILHAFRPFDALAVAGRLDVGEGDCPAPNPPASCDWRMPPVPQTVDYDGLAAGTCLEPLANTTGGYSPAIVSATAPCYVSEAFDTTVLLLGANVPLRAARTAAQLGAGVPPSSLSPGLWMGFLRESDADATFVNALSLGTVTLSSLLPGGTGNCAAQNDLDLGPQGESGWWIYFNFVAGPVNFVGR